MYVVLRTRYHDEASLKEHILRLAIALEAHAISSAPMVAAGPNNSGPSINQARDVIWSGKVDVSEDPILVVEELGEEDDAQNILLIWRLQVFLSTCSIVANEHY